MRAGSCVPPHQWQGVSIMKSKTHSGAKKRMTLLKGGKVKRKSTRRRHLLSNKDAGRMRNLEGVHYVHSANINQTRRLLNF